MTAQDIIETTIREELLLGGDPKSMASAATRILAEEGYAIVRMPVVAFKGPNDTDAGMLLTAAERAEAARFIVGGSNVGRAVAQVLREVAEQMQGPVAALHDSGAN